MTYFILYIKVGLLFDFICRAKSKTKVVHYISDVLKTYRKINNIMLVFKFKKNFKCYIGFIPNKILHKKHL